MGEVTVVFREEGKAWRGPGAPPVAVPPELAGWLDRTYRDKSVCELPCDPNSEDAAPGSTRAGAAWRSRTSSSSATTPTGSGCACATSASTTAPTD